MKNFCRVIVIAFLVGLLSWENGVNCQEKAKAEDGPMPVNQGRFDLIENEIKKYLKNIFKDKIEKCS